MILELNRLINKHPNNIAFFSDEELKEMFQNYLYLTETVKNAICAEVLTRYWLFKTNYNMEYLCDIIPLEKQEIFWDLTKKNRENSQKKLDENIEFPFNSELNKKLISSLNTFLTCDGIILVVKNKIAYPVPFSLRNNGNLDKMIVNDIKNHKIKNWTKSLENLQQYGVNSWNININVEDYEDSLIGHSLDLPVLMAIEKKEGRLEYPPLDILATGSFALGGAITNVEQIKEKRVLADKLQSKIFFIPEQDEMKVSESTISIPKNMTIKESMGMINDKLNSTGLSKLSWREAVEKLKNLENSVHFGVIALEQSAIPKVERYEKIFEEKNKIEFLLQSKSLKATIYCHLGRTDDSFKLSEECQSLAQRYKKDDIYINCAIKQIVNLTDLGDFEQALNQANFIKNRINSEFLYNDELSMKFYGTIGQALLYKNLSDTIPQKVLEYFKKAAQFAKNSLELGDICQDLNYIHLYHTVTNFNSIEDIRAYEKAEKEIRKLSPDQQKRNLAYLYRAS